MVPQFPHSGSASMLAVLATFYDSALFAVLQAGLAKRHNANQAASLKVQSTFALPVLLSGVASLTLNSVEFDVLDKHFKQTLRTLLKLPDRTPDPVIYFLAGKVPIKAYVHRRQLSIFCMISRLLDNILYKLASKILLTEPDSSKSWFVRIRVLCNQYSLPSPLDLLLNPRSKNTFNKLVKSKITDYWENSLRSEAASKTSLKYFKPVFMSLTAPHPMFLSCGTNPFETNKSICQAALISGRFKTDYLARHWTKENPDGFCLLCSHLKLHDTVEHFLVFCCSLAQARENVMKYWQSFSSEDDILRNLLAVKLGSPTQTLVQFLIDPSADSDFIQGVQQKVIQSDDVFKLTRTWCYALQRLKLQLTGKFRKI